MPVKFACHHCEKVLLVSSRKIGRRADCPNCGERITIPDKQAGAESLKHISQEAGDDGSSDNPFEQFTVYDDDPELDYGDEATGYEPHDERPVDHQRVAVPRIVLYIQGGLLGAVALVFFVFGILCGFGIGTMRDGKADVAQCEVVGRVRYKTPGGEIVPDDGAVVIIVPQDNPPDKPAQAVGLRPDDEPDDDADGIWSIRGIGGAYSRTDADGKFTLKVLNQRRYYILYISKKAQRSDATAAIDKKHLAELGNFFSHVPILLENRKYQWHVVTLHGTEKSLGDVVFE